MSTMETARGFTLVELLVSLAIAAIVLLPLTDMLRAGADSARFVRAGLDQNADARFAINYLAARAMRAKWPKMEDSPGDLAAWLSHAKLAYAVTEQGTLVESDSSINPQRKSLLAAGVRSFRMSMSENGAGRPLLRIEIVLNRPDCDIGAGQDCSLTHVRTVRFGDSS